MKTKLFLNRFLLTTVLFIFAIVASQGLKAQEFFKVYVNQPGSLTPDASVGNVNTETFSSLAPNNNNWAPLPNGYSSSVGTFYQTTGNATSYIKNNDQYGANTGKYMSVKAGGIVTLKFTQPVRYFGFAWPAGDNDNKIKLYRNNQLLATISTSDVKHMLPKNNSQITAINGSQYTTSHFYGQPGTGRNGNEPYAYLNFYASPGMAFDKVELLQRSGSGGQFETDNFAIVNGNPNVPGDWALLYTIQPPTAVNDSAVGTPGNNVIVNVLSNDLAGDNPIDPGTVKIEGTSSAGDSYTVTGEGTWSVNTNNGKITFTPESGFTGNPTPIQYSVQDDQGYYSNLATVKVTYPVGPTAVDDQVTIGMNQTVRIPVLNNDTAGSSPITTVTLVSGTQPDPNTVGTFTVTNGNPKKIKFIPVHGFTGTTTVDYKICDQYQLCSTATVTLNVLGNARTNFPSRGYGTLAFEDLWPAKGDYDFNDMVIDYKFRVISDPQNFVKKVKATFILKAFGASMENGFGFQLPSAVNASNVTVSGYQLNENYIQLDPNGTEANQNKTTIIVFDNAFKLMRSPGGIGVNTDPSYPYVTPDTLKLIITFNPGTTSVNDLDIGNFNPFIIVNKNRSVEVHLADYPPTALADQSLFGTADDNSDAAQGRYYKTVNGLPWAINLYHHFDYPKEKQSIIKAYLKFAEWASSGGNAFPDWYLNHSGYRDNTYIYVIP